MWDEDKAPKQFPDSKYGRHCLHLLGISQMKKLLRQNASLLPLNSTSLDQITYLTNICEINKEERGGGRRQQEEPEQCVKQSEQKDYVKLSSVVFASCQIGCSLSNVLICKAAWSLTSPSTYHSLPYVEVFLIQSSGK